MDRAKFFAALRVRNSGLFGASLSGDQVRGTEGIIDAFDAVGDGNADTLAYALASAYHETGRRMVPVREGFASTDAGARAAVNKLAKQRGPNSAPAKYAQPQPPHGHVYYGRGHVQLTWLDNYRRSSADAGTDLVANPDAMLDPVISARVLIKGLLDGRWNGQGRGLRWYLDRGDVVGARRTVNILDKAEMIAGYHRSFLAAIMAAGGVKPAPAKVVPLPVPKPAPTAGVPSTKPLVLVKGSRGAEVAQLIRDLHTLGFYDGRIDDIYGDATVKAVTALQRAHRLNVDGKAGSETLGAIAGAMVAAASRPTGLFAAALLDAAETELPSPTEKDATMNANMIHNILNLLGLIVASLILYDWTALGLSPSTAATVTAGVLLADKVIKLAMNVTRDGVGGLWKVQPPVER